MQQKNPKNQKRNKIVALVLWLVDLMRSMRKLPVVTVLSSPVIRLLECGRRIELVTPMQAIANDDLYRVPTGFNCDGASIPRPLWWLCGSPLVGKYRLAAIVHDAAYAGDLQVKIDDNFTRAKLTRKQADKLFLACMLFAGCNPLRARIKYLAVRLFGGKHFERG